MRSLITGASGFAGRALHTYLETAGGEVVAWSRRNGDPDICDRPRVTAAISAAQPDVIYHLAAQSNVPTAWANPAETMRINNEGTQNILDAAIETGGARVVLISSAAVYGEIEEAELPITEATELRPSNPYAESKVAAERAAIEAAHRGLDVICIRAFNHFGPGQSTDFAAPAFASRIARAKRDGKESIEVGLLDARRDFTDVRDVVRAYHLAATLGDTGMTYNVCSGVDRSMRDISNGFVKRSGANISFVHSPELERPAETPVIRGSAQRLRDKTGWEPEIAFEQSLDDIYEEALANLAGKCAPRDNDDQKGSDD